MTTSSNAKVSSQRDEQRRWEEEMDRLWKEFEEAREAAERSLIKLEVIEELESKR